MTRDEEYKNALNAYMNIDARITKTLRLIAIGAIKKQIPKKVEYGNDNSWGVNKEVPVCPVCDYFLTQTYFIGNGQKTTYCDHCGQKLDWGE